MDEITSTELTEHKNFHGDLISLQILTTKDGKGALALDIHAGGGKYIKSHHLVLTDKLQLMSELNRIRGILDPSPEDHILAELKTIRKLMEERA